MHSLRCNSAAAPNTAHCTAVHGALHSTVHSGEKLQLQSNALQPCSQTQPLMLTRHKVGDAPFVNMHQPTSPTTSQPSLFYRMGGQTLLSGQINMHQQQPPPNLMSFLTRRWDKQVLT